MDNKKLIGAAVTFLALLGIAIYVVWERDASNEEVVAEVPELPPIEQGDVTALVITRPVEDGEPVPVRMEKQGDTWRVVSPVEAEADQSAIETALQKLAGLEVTGLAAENTSSHELLQVDEANGIRVEAVVGDSSVATLWIGAFRSRSTMVRVDGQDAVVSVSGSIRYAFNKELKDWRNRRVLDEDPADIVAVRFASENGTFEFARNASDEWEQREPEGVELPEPYAPIENFGPTKVQSVVASVARLRAVNFADEGTDAAAAGFTPPSGVVTLTIEERPDEPEEAEEDGEDSEESEETEGDEAPEAEEPAAPAAPAVRRTVVLEVGGQNGEEREFYLRRQGGETIYVVSQYIADRVRPNAEDLHAPEPGEEPATPMMPPGMPGLGLGGPGGPGGPGGGIPPELMQKIQQQLQQQQAGS